MYCDNIFQTWCQLVQDYQNLNHQLEAVEGSIPGVGLVEETEERLMDRITLYQVLCDIITWIRIWEKISNSVIISRNYHLIQLNTTELDYRDVLIICIHLYISIKGLKGRLTEHQHKLHQLLDEGKHLLVSVCCPSLENQLALLGEHWLSNTSKINNELQRLEAILKHWTRSGLLYFYLSLNNNE